MSGTYIARLFFSLIIVSCAASFFVSRRTPASTSVLISHQSASPLPLVHGGQPVVSPDGSRIAFTSNRDGADDVFVISTNGRNERQLTNTRESEGNLAWTASGKQILFSVFKADTSHLYGIDADGKNQRELASVPGRAPTLSPDGRRLLYMAGTWTATRLMVSALDGTNAKQITDGLSIAWNNHWSPDGKLIAFTGRNDPKGELAVFIMNADGSSRRQATHIPAEEGGAQWPVWSPNGRQLAIQVNSRTQKNSARTSGSSTSLQAKRVNLLLTLKPIWTKLHPGFLMENTSPSRAIGRGRWKCG